MGLSSANQHGNRQDKMASTPRLTVVIITLLKKATVMVIAAQQSPEDEHVCVCMDVYVCACLDK